MEWFSKRKGRGDRCIDDCLSSESTAFTILYLLLLPSFFPTSFRFLPLFSMIVSCECAVARSGRDFYSHDTSDVYIYVYAAIRGHEWKLDTQKTTVQGRFSKDDNAKTKSHSVYLGSWDIAYRMKTMRRRLGYSFLGNYLQAVVFMPCCRLPATPEALRNRKASRSAVHGVQGLDQLMRTQLKFDSRNPGRGVSQCD